MTLHDTLTHVTRQTKHKPVLGKPRALMKPHRKHAHNIRQGSDARCDQPICPRAGLGKAAIPLGKKLPEGPKAAGNSHRSAKGVGQTTDGNASQPLPLAQSLPFSRALPISSFLSLLQVRRHSPYGQTKQPPDFSRKSEDGITFSSWSSDSNKLC